MVPLLAKVIHATEAVVAAAAVNTAACNSKLTTVKSWKIYFCTSVYTGYNCYDVCVSVDS